nr:MAG TPA_asm: hypothetical protein [Caudoviricetes sp.]
MTGVGVRVLDSHYALYTQYTRNCDSQVGPRSEAAEI